MYLFAQIMSKFKEVLILCVFLLAWCGCVQDEQQLGIDQGSVWAATLTSMASREGVLVKLISLK